MSASDERTPLLRKDTNQSASVDQSPADPTPSTQSSSSGRRQNELETVTDMPSASFMAPILTTLWILVACSALDATIVATLISTISSEFGQSEQASWLGTSYLLGFTAVAPIYARLCDIIGRKVALFLSVSLFTFGTLLCGVAGSMKALLFGRLVAGCGGGGFPTIVAVILTTLVPLRHRGILQGYTNLVYGVAAAAGGPIGGWLNDSTATGWRINFLLQIPLLAIALVLIYIFIPAGPRLSVDEVRANQPQSDVRAGQESEPSRTLGSRIKKTAAFAIDMDVPGNILLVTAIVTFLIAVSLMASNDAALSSPKIAALLVTAAISIVVFFIVEWLCGRREHQGSRPVIPLRIFKNRTVIGVAGSNFFIAIPAYTVMYMYPLIFEAVLLQAPKEAGLHLVPYSIVISAGAILSGFYVRRTGHYYWFMLLNTVLAAVSILLFCNITDETPVWYTYLAVCPHVFGFTSMFTVSIVGLLNDIDTKDTAVVIGMLYLVRPIGQVLGVAIPGFLLQAVLKSQLRRRISGPDAEEIVSRIRHQASEVAKLPPEIRLAAIESYKVALRTVFYAAIGSGLVSAALVALVRNKPLPDLKKDGKAPVRRAAGDEEAEPQTPSSSE